MKRASAYLPVLIVLAFPMLYYSGNAGNSVLSVIAILVLLLGMSGPISKRMM